MVQQSQLDRQRTIIAQVNTTSNYQNKAQHEQHFIETCISELTFTNHEPNSDSNRISQTEFAAFIIRYCRYNENVRGPKCLNTLFFFQDLPVEVQLEFLRLSDDACPFDIVDESMLQDCLDQLNADGGLFFITSDRSSDLCSSTTFDVLIYTDLLLLVTITPQPISPFTPTSTPLNLLQSQQPTIGQNLDPGDDAGLSTVGIMAIVMTLLFIIMFLIQCTLLYRRKETSKNRQIANDVIALREDESVVASEHSHELLSPIAELESFQANVSSCKNSDNPMASTLASNEDVHPKKSYGMKWSLSTPSNSEQLLSKVDHGPRKSTTPRSSATATSRFRSFSSDYGGESRSKDPAHNFLNQIPVVTEKLSDNNPVHVRKRFQKKLAGNFPFDENDVNRSIDIIDSSKDNKNSPKIILQTTEKENDVVTGRIAQRK